MNTVALALVLCLLLPALVTAGSTGPQAADGVLTAWPEAQGAVTIPPQAEGQPLRAIGPGVFYLNGLITSASLPQGVRLIQENAFYGCGALEQVQLPDSLQAIDSQAFFGSEALKEVSIPPGVAVIGQQAFAFCRGLETVTFLGAPPRLVGPQAFDQVTAAFKVPKEHLAAYQALLGVACQPGEPAIPVDCLAPMDQLVLDAQGVLTGYLGDSTVVDLPKGITALADQPFAAQPRLRAVSLPEGLTRIGDGAFMGSGLAHISLPQSLTTIKQNAFRGTALTQVALPQRLIHLGEGAFAYSRLRSIQLPRGIVQVPVSAFEGNIWLEEASLGPNTSAIDDNAFKGCTSLRCMVLPVTHLPVIGADAFAGCPLADVFLSPTATLAQAQAAQNTLRGMDIPAQVWRGDPPDMPPYPNDAQFTFDENTGLITSYQGDLEAMTMYWTYRSADGSRQVPVKGLADGVFEGASLQRFAVPRSNAFVHIGARAFKDSRLREIDLFDSVAFIGRDAFSGCDQLEQLVLPHHVRVEGDLGLPAEKILVRRQASPQQLAQLREDLNYPWYLTLRRVGEPDPFLPMPARLTPNPDSHFAFDPATGTLTKYMGNTQDVVVPSLIGGVAVRAIGELAFWDGSPAAMAAGTQSHALRSVVLPHTVRSIADSAFLNTPSLERFECYGPVDLVGSRAFEKCEWLETVIFHNGVQALGDYAFHLCGALGDLRLGYGLTALGEGALRGCAAITRLMIPASLQRMESGALVGMTALTSLCFERAEPVFEGAAFPLPENQGLTIYLPEETTDEALARFQRVLNNSMMAPMDNITRQACPPR